MKILHYQIWAKNQERSSYQGIDTKIKAELKTMLKLITSEWNFSLFSILSTKC